MHQYFDGFTVAVACSDQYRAIAIAVDLVDAGGVFPQEPGQKLVVAVAGCQGNGAVTGFIDLLAIDARVLQPLGHALVAGAHRVQKQVIAIGVDPFEIGILRRQPLRQHQVTVGNGLCQRIFELVVKVCHRRIPTDQPLYHWLVTVACCQSQGGFTVVVFVVNRLPEMAVEPLYKRQMSTSSSQRQGIITIKIDVMNISPPVD